ncbi:MAG: RNA polymerase sigma factor [Prevotellaceae bacterium]|jgi:RNA polymerase sigma factor (sigma-70 family)|nr:RNA polymerase sigma factor [Prevotellaceae bacterium]
MSPETPPHNRFAEAFKNHQAALRGFIAKRMPSKEDCEDVLQDVFYRLLKTADAESPIQQVSAWLYAVARNLIIDRRRKHREDRLSQYPRDDDDGEYCPEPFYDDGLSVETEYLRTLVWDALADALAELPDEQRAVFELMELEGFSVREISESTGVGVNTLLSRKYYAVQHLRRRLKGLYEELASPAGSP